MKEIDARGLDCPRPVVKTRNALQDEEELSVIVDNKVAAENVGKLARKLGCKVNKLKEDDNYFALKIVKGKTDKKNPAVNNEVTERKEKERELGKEKIYFLTSDSLGEGEEELGRFLLKGFLHTLLELEPLPAKIIFMNKGVKVPTLNHEAIESLKKLAAEGVTILSCGTCLDYYNLKNDLKVGSISNMYEILASLNRGNVVKV